MIKGTVALDDTQESFNQMLQLQLDAAFKDQAFKDFLLSEIASKHTEITNQKELFGIIGGLINAALEQSNTESLGFDPIVQLEAMSEYVQTVSENHEVYGISNKPNPHAVFWPNPTRNPDESIYTTQPYIQPLNLIDKQTPVGSAGSCFGEEIAYQFQKRGFNYVVTETEGNDQEGVSFSDYSPDNPYARFSANWGILFNSPSFRQLAEKSFGIRNLPRILVPEVNDGRTTYSSPFREGVYFESVDAFDANYDKHIAATREALVKSEVFIITLGLNECWEFLPDNSVLSRNPRQSKLGMLVRPKVLSVQDNIENIQGFIDIVREHNPSLKLIISVSPIPFLATTRAEECHVVTANSHSKAVLRVAAEEIVKTNEDVYYFPSYELVSTCTKEPWAEDHRHVSRETVDKVMLMFNAMFVKNGLLVDTPS